MNASELGLLERDLINIRSAIRTFPQIEKAVIFGSRAMGNYKKGSDIDIACYGENVDFDITTRLKSILNEECPIPFFVDVLHFGALGPGQLRKHIEQHGKAFYHAQKDNITK